MPRLNLNDLPLLEHSFTEDELKGFVGELQRTLNVFKKKFGINEMTAHEYISTFIKIAVCYIQVYTNKSAQLSMEIDLDETKVENMNKKIAQVLVQMHSAAKQQLGKRKHSQMKQAIFRIVTTRKL
ncbi:8190_t:CDS:2 [Dentiscutata erythropus]|uniref:8190_t:CDS:1 n=1 Tax=Dentiscutata erythropus TaxID=1348616 RepID=A0A9N9IMA4_9GLOM|nr:8190_t:CDS:2 [Dentiscutata erythropus]